MVSNWSAREDAAASNLVFSVKPHTTEERQKTAGENPEQILVGSTFFLQEKSERQKTIEKIIKMWYQCKMQSGIPIFKVQSDEEAVRHAQR